MPFLNWLPLIALAVMLLASLLRGRAVRRQSGVSAWAFMQTAGTARLAGLLFAGSIGMIVFASGLLAGRHLVDPVAAIPAGLLCLAGLAIVVIAQLQMGAAWRIGFREGDAPLFVSRGLYRVSRNPIFLGMIMVAVGTAIAAGYWWTWAAAGLFALVCHIQVMLEERHLAANFGDAYAAFRQQVPRWLGKLR